MATKLPGLEPARIGDRSPLHRSQRYLASAYDSVASLIETTYPALRATRVGTRGRLTHAEQDVFRAAVVFAGAGLDAVFKEALRSSIPLRVEASEAAREKYQDFVERHLRHGEVFDTRRLATLLISHNPRDELMGAYIEALTGSSLQSQHQVTQSLAALGLQEETGLFRDSRELNSLFRTRNEIAHEMDMTRAAIESGRGKRSRYERSMTDYISMCHTALNYSQRVLNRLDETLGSDSPRS